MLEGEDAAVALAPGSARRRALDAALAELDAGAAVPSVAWRQRWSLLLGLERLLSQDEPRLVDGTVLSAHQVDALSGTLTALLAEAQRNGDPTAPSPPVDGAARAGLRRPSRARRTSRTRTSPRSRRTGRTRPRPPRRRTSSSPSSPRTRTPPSASGSSTRRAPARRSPRSASSRPRAPAATLILTHRRNLVDQFLGELRDRGYAKRIAPAAAARPGPRRRPGDGRDLPVVRAQRGQRLRRLHDRHLRRGAHRAGREDVGGDPQLVRGRCSSA